MNFFNVKQFYIQLKLTMTTLLFVVLLSSCSQTTPNKMQGEGVSMPLELGPYQSNGASPWFTYMGIGTPEQEMKFSLDTGSNFVWVTSTLCTPQPKPEPNPFHKPAVCVHDGETQFDPTKGGFKWIPPYPEAGAKKVDFGPWGAMDVKLGESIFNFNNGVKTNSSIYLSTEYQGIEFEELDWDGGIGMPAGSEFMDKDVSFIFKDLMDEGVIDPNKPYLTFETNQQTKKGTASMGQLNTDYSDELSYVFLPWVKYTDDSAYLWSTSLTSMKVGSETVTDKATNVIFALDSGSSEFKGDVAIMRKTKRITAATNETVEIVFSGQSNVAGSSGVLKIPSNIYNVEIEEGQGKGTISPQFNGLEGAGNLVLVGSVLMDHLYTVYEYEVSGIPGDYKLSPVGMWIFNKKGDYPIIQTQQSEPARIFKH
ncbi:MAG: A1 family peptidase [Alteromonadales bacterium]|nr:A1 family peptidase [Alteromonadales bacterium]